MEQTDSKAVKARIMIVEDNEIISMEFKHKLEDIGYKVVATVNSGEDAITKAIETIPDLILMDIQLRGKMDGIEAAEKIRSVQDVPIIFLSAYSDITTNKRVQPFDYLAKPIEETELQSTIELSLYKHKMRGVD